MISRTFAEDQIEEWSDRVKDYLANSSQGIDAKKYSILVRKFGADPNKAPLDAKDLPYEVQICLAIYSYMPVIPPGMGGFIGKDFSTCFTFFDMYDVEDQARFPLMRILKSIDEFYISENKTHGKRRK